ncbi:hypothetical protein [Streptomyces nojiriensis]|uniref:hypothetical protein n=1 Tax=Streptomyces nojiriensis TaxID=66374 RepID=UPI0036B6F8A5
MRTMVTVAKMDQNSIPEVSKLFAFKDLRIHIQECAVSNGADAAQKAASDIWSGQVVRDLPELAPEKPATNGHASRFYGWEAS